MIPMPVPSLELARPEVLWLLLLLLPWGAWRWWSARRSAVPFAPLQHRAPSTRRWWAALVLPVELALLGAVILGLAGPHSVHRLERFDDEGVDVVLVLDVSLSMLAEDFPPNRLAALRDLAERFVARSGGNRLGLVVFAGDAYVQSPLTTDRRVMEELLGSVGVHLLNQGASGGTALGDALLVAGDRLAASRQEGRDQAVVLITDGESNLGIDPVLAARHLAEQEVRLYAIGIGGTRPVEVFFEGHRLGNPDDPYLAVLDVAELRRVTEAADGRFFRATDVGALEAVFDELSRLESAPLEVRTVEIRHGHTRWLALAALLLFAAHLALGGVAARRPFR